MNLKEVTKIITTLHIGSTPLIRRMYFTPLVGITVFHGIYCFAVEMSRAVEFRFSAEIVQFLEIHHSSAVTLRSSVINDE